MHYLSLGWLFYVSYVIIIKYFLSIFAIICIKNKWNISSARYRNYESQLHNE